MYAEGGCVALVIGMESGEGDVDDGNLRSPLAWDFSKPRKTIRSHFLFTVMRHQTQVNKESRIHTL